MDAPQYSDLLAALVATPDPRGRRGTLPRANGAAVVAPGGGRHVGSAP
jgi:hypothetical protein